MQLDNSGIIYAWVLVITATWKLYAEKLNTLPQGKAAFPVIRIEANEVDCYPMWIYSRRVFLATKNLVRLPNWISMETFIGCWRCSQNVPTDSYSSVVLSPNVLCMKVEFSLLSMMMEKCIMHKSKILAFEVWDFWIMISRPTQ